MKPLRWTAVLVAAAVLLTGCGEIKNTLAPEPGTADTVTVALDGPAGASDVGLFAAQADGYFRQTDLIVHFLSTSDPVGAITSGRAQLAISNEPDVLLARNAHTALASVAAILQTPATVSVTCATPKPGRSGGSGTRAAGSRTGTSPTTTSTPRAHAPLPAPRCRAVTHANPDHRWAAAPTYNARNLVVTEHEIVNHAPILRRFIQAVGRGYAAARTDPATATAALVRLNPGLSLANERLAVDASLADFFPSGSDAQRPWGWQVVNDWNAFGSWLLDHHVITNLNATPGADTNELLAGQGV